MGGGCFKANTAEDPQRSGRGKYSKLIPRSSSSTQAATDDPTKAELKSDLAQVIQLAGSTAVSEENLDEVLQILSTVPPHSSVNWLTDWCMKASAKQRGGLLHLMQSAIGRALEPNLVVAEEIITSEGREAGDSSEFGILADLCRDALRIDPVQRTGVHAAMSLLSHASSSGQVATHNGATLSSVVPVLDKLVLTFRTSLLAHITTSAKNRQQWRELERYIGVPPLEQHMSLLSCGAKAVLLNLLLVPDGVPPVIVVVNRERALLDAGNQIPDDHLSVLSPYFESATGTKTVQGRHVEGGEGHGPRKEFFIATSSDALRRWGNARSSSSTPSSASRVHASFKGNRITLDRAPDCRDEARTTAGKLMSRTLENACVGDRLQLVFSNDIEAERLITATHGDSGVSVASQFDSSVCNDCVTVRHCGLQKALVPLFEFHRGTGQHWFSAYACELDHPKHGTELQFRFLTFGKLLLLALVNRCKIAFALPIIFFQLLLHTDSPVCLDDLRGFDDDLHISLKKCLKMNLTQFNSLKEVEGLPESMSREGYIKEKVIETFTPQALQEIRKGFWGSSRANVELLKSISAGDLRQIICPTGDLTDDINIRHIFNIVMEEEMAECRLFVDSFWSVIDNFTLEEKKLFLRFVTGLEAPPEPGTERLLIELPFSAFSKAEYSAMLEMLPQAHTCTNTLELPNYYDALKESGRVADDGEDAKGGPFDEELQRIIGVKLRMAIRETAGYELDATDAVASDDSVRPTHNEVLPLTEVDVLDDKRTVLVAPASTASTARSSFVESVVEVEQKNIGESTDKGKIMSDSDARSEGHRSDDGLGSECNRSYKSCSPAPPSSESLQSLRSEPEEPGNRSSAAVHPWPSEDEAAVHPWPPAGEEAAVHPWPDEAAVRRNQPSPYPESVKPYGSLRLAPVKHEPRLEPVSTETLKNDPRQSSHTLDPLRAPLRPPVPFMGDFGNPQHASSDVDEIFDQGSANDLSNSISLVDPGGLTTLFHSTYKHENHQHNTGKMYSSDIDHLIEELELDLGK